MNDARLAELLDELLAALADEQHAALMAYAEENAEAWRRFLAEEMPP